MTNIAIFSLEADLHAHAVLHALRERGATNVHFIASDAQVTNGGLTWLSAPASHARIRSYEGAWIDVAGLDVVWWRRVNQAQTHYLSIDDPTERAFMDNEWKAAITGLMHEAFTGVWVNYPSHEIIAGNKLYQLNAAARQGFRTPRTLVSSDADEVLEFCHGVGGTVIAKKLMGAPPLPLASVLLTYEQLQENQDSIRLCPAMYQEFVQGNRHLRVNCFGEDIHSTLIESGVLDWRRDLSVPFAPIRLDLEVEERLRRVVRDLNLMMGVMDLIMTDDELVWLELNTQGQFLFCEALSGYDLTTPFADFLLGLGREGMPPSAPGPSGASSHLVTKQQSNPVARDDRSEAVAL
jgi:glutathione synthase/RimK-type ligase-like ATP-grasp enzyme